MRAQQSDEYNANEPAASMRSASTGSFRLRPLFLFLIAHPSGDKYFLAHCMAVALEKAPTEAEIFRMTYGFAILFSHLKLEAAELSGQHLGQKLCQSVRYKTRGSAA